MPRPTKRQPERGDARTRILEVALDAIRLQGFAATSVDELCADAGVTKGAFFHHFKSKEEMGVAAAQFWTDKMSALYEAAPYHQLEDPLDRILGYVDFRISLIRGDTADWSCLVGTMVQEVCNLHPPVRDACAVSIFSHAKTLEADIAAARSKYGSEGNWSPGSLARHIQSVLQGAFILAKASDNPAAAHESLAHLKYYIECLFRSSSSGVSLWPVRLF